MRTAGVDRAGCDAARHGTYVAYVHYDCTCPDAREDWRLYAKRHRQGRAESRWVDGTGTLRRIQALMAVGHTAATIGEVAGTSRWQVVTLLDELPHRQVHVTTAARVRAAYRLLADQPGASTITRARAAGWARPIDWDDDTIDDPAARPAGAVADSGAVDPEAVRQACAGRLAWKRLNQAERLAAYRRLADGGASMRRIARTLHVSEAKVREFVAIMEAAA